MRTLLAMVALFWALPLSASANYTTMTTVSLQASGMVYDPVTNLLYASSGNTITTINPYTATIVASYTVGNDPGQLVIGASGGVLYAALGTQINGENAILPFNTVTDTAGSPILLPAPASIDSMAVNPVNSNVLAVSTINRNISPGFIGTTIYNNGVAGTPQTGVVADSIAFSADGTRLYGYDNTISTYGYSRFAVSGSSLKLLSDQNTAIIGNANITYNTGRIFSDSGVVLNAETGTSLGVGGSGSSVLADGANGRAFSIDYNAFIARDQLGFYTINNDPNSFSYTTTQTFVVPLYVGITDLTEYGPNGLAVIATNGSIYLFTLTVPEPGSLLLTAMGLFLSAGGVYFHKWRRPTVAN